MENLFINTIRSLSAEMVLKANSGHQGTPISAAPIGYVLYNDVMKHNPKNSLWFNRDRFILSAGHASALQYSLLHLFGYDLTMDDLKNFRQLGSKTPGHPEYSETDGVELTTGPLGQGISNAVGFALAEKHLAAKFNTEDIKIVDHYTYVLAGDGCLMEGVSNEASSLAGTLGLDKLIVLYDSNNITIDTRTDATFTEDTAKRYEALGWQVLEVKDANDIEELKNAIIIAKEDKERPSLIQIHSIIGYGSPKADTSLVHGNPLKAEDIKEMKKTLGYEYEEEFFVSDEIRKYISEKQEVFSKNEKDWNEKLEEYKKKYPKKYEDFEKALNNTYDFSFLEEDEFYHFDKDLASRAASGISLNKIAKHVDNLIGGSADLAGSNNTTIEGKGFFSKETSKEPNLHYGIREHAMGAIANGIQLHGGLHAYTGTFLSFADYMKPALRLAALMKKNVIFIFTHDSIGLGEDGPTHQAVDQLPMLRAIPNMITIRPADNRETAAAWAYTIKEQRKPVSLILSRQSLKSQQNSGKGLFKGAYVLKDFGENPEYLIIATGSEVSVAVDAANILHSQGKSVRVVSMPSIELFEQQDETYKEEVLSSNIKYRIAIEASSEKAFYKYIGMNGLFIGMETFGVSAPAEDAFEYFGFTGEKVAEKINKKFN